MAEKCSDRAIYTDLSLADLEKVFPNAKVVYSGGALKEFTENGVAIWDSSGTSGNQKIIRVNGACPGAENGQCKIANLCGQKEL